MSNDEVSRRTVEAFRKFVLQFPHNKDPELVILKGHLLIEEQVRQIVDERVKSPEMLRRNGEGLLNCYQAICLAQAFFPADHKPHVWASIKQLNTLRNKLAHNLEPPELEKKINDFIQAWPSGFKDLEDKAQKLELTLWSLWVAVAELVERPSAKIIELIK